MVQNNGLFYICQLASLAKMCKMELGKVVEHHSSGKIWG
jgi:hypothetical protein